MNKLCTSSLVDTVMFSHNDPGRVASAPCWSKWSKLPTYSPEGATLFDLAVVHNGSKLRTAGKVWSVRLSCYHLFTKIRRCNGDESAEKSRKLVQAFWKCVGSQRWLDFGNAVWLINMRTKNAFSFFYVYTLHQTRYDYAWQQESIELSARTKFFSIRKNETRFISISF